MKAVTVRVRAVPTDRSDLVCIGCGGFRTELAVTNGADPQAGLHKRCIGIVKVRRGALDPGHERLGS